MRNRSTLSWTIAMRELHGDRPARAGVREERLRATTGLRRDLGLTSWRGLSGRRYVVGVHAPGEAELAETTDAVLLAVRRAADGEASLLDVASPSVGLPRRARLRWIAAMRVRGATEFHVHRLAETDDERRSVVRDLLAGAA